VDEAHARAEVATRTGEHEKNSAADCEGVGGGV